MTFAAGRDARREQSAVPEGDFGTEAFLVTFLLCVPLISPSLYLFYNGILRVSEATFWLLSHCSFSAKNKQKTHPNQTYYRQLLTPFFQVFRTKTLEYSLTSLFHTTPPIHQPVSLALPLKYTQNPTTSHHFHGWSKPPSYLPGFTKFILMLDANG